MQFAVCVLIFATYAGYSYGVVPLWVMVLVDLAVVAYYARKKFAPTWTLHTPR